MLCIRTKKFRIDHMLNHISIMKLWTLSNEHCRLYNHLLDKTRDTEVGADFKKLNSSYVEYRNDNSLTIPSKSAQNTCRSLISNIKSFYALRKTDKTARFPRYFKSTRVFNSFTYDWNCGIGGFKIKDNVLKLLNVDLSIPLHPWVRDIENVKTITFSGEDEKIFLSITYGKEICSEQKLNAARFLSLDPGLLSILTGVTCDGEFFKIANLDARAGEKSIDKLISKRAKKKKHSKRYIRISKTLSKKRRKVVDRRRDYHHKLTSAVVDFCLQRDIGTIIHGDIETKKLKDSKFASRGMNRSTQNRGSLSRIKGFLAYKAEEAGISHNLQNEAYTSKTNCLTGEIMENISLATREIALDEDITIDRDVNGAINIASKFYHQHQGAWYAQKEWLTTLRDTPIIYNWRMSKFV